MRFEEIIKLPWREMIGTLEKGSPTNCRWTDVRDWIESTYTQEQITKINVLLWICMNNLGDYLSDEVKIQEFDDLSDAIEPWWYAMGDIENFNNGIKPYLEKDK